MTTAQKPDYIRLSTEILMSPDFCRTHKGAYNVYVFCHQANYRQF